MRFSGRLPHPDRVADPGVQSERTYLAWQRTGLSFAAIGAALVQFAETGPQRASEVIGLYGIAVGGALLAVATLRYRHSVPAARGEHPAALPLLMLLTAVTSAVLGVGALLLTFNTPIR
ncbi:MAG TPA: DUF202 domain-containing protein [Propionibacteriaceae bacterium]|nr:DUF202 domain-containing protein [Propionibacteriaceae bacterium]